MSQLQAGFSRVNITPPMGIRMRGYLITRHADGVLDELEINTIALRHGEKSVLLMSMDLANFTIANADAFRANISQRTGVPVEAIYIQANHTHTGPYLLVHKDDPLEQQYYDLLYTRLADAAQMALDDLKPAKMGWGVSHAPNISFIRRYRMKDGSVRTNPGVNNPDVLEPVGKVDDEVIVLRFDREGGDSLVLMNFADHPDTVGGCKISADWPGFARRELEKAIDGVKSVLFNGAQGDVNHVNVRPKGGDLNGMILDFDDVSRGYSHARHMGRVIAGAVMQVYDKVEYKDVDSIDYINRGIDIPSNMPKPEEMEEARYLVQMHKEGRDSELPYKGMMLTTKVAEASRKIRLEHGPESFHLTLSGVAIGNVAMVGIQGEPFNGIGCGLKEAEGWDAVLPTCITNGGHGYYPMKDSYDEGGYEAGTSNYKAGVAELLIEEGKKMLAQLRK